MSQKNYWDKFRAARISRRRFIESSAVGAASVAAIAAVGCGDDSDNGGSTPAATSGGGSTPAAQRGGTLRVATQQDAFNLGPFTSASGRDHHYFYQLYDGLMEYNPENLVPENRLAEKIEVQSPTELTVTLKQGVKFHDGTDLTADVVAANIDFVRSADKGSLHTGLVSSIDHTEVVDPSTLRIILKEPDAALIDMFAYNPGLMQSLAALEAEPGTNPVGAGPFKYKSRVEGDLTEFERFDGYWSEGLPHLDGIRIKLIPDDTTRVTALQTGEQDLIIATPPQSIKSLEGDSNVVVHKGVTLTHHKVYVHSTRKPFDDIRLRRAFNLAIDRQEIVDKVHFGQADPALGTLTPVQWAYDKNAALSKYDPDEAKSLVEAAGANGLEFNATTYTSGPSLQTAELLQAQVAKVGLKMNIITGESKDWAPRLGKGEIDGVVVALSVGAADPDFQFRAYYLPGGQWNQNRHNVPEVTDLINKARATYDQEERTQMYRDLDRLTAGVAEDEFALDALLVYPYDAISVRKNVDGFVFYGDGKIRLRDVSLS